MKAFPSCLLLLLILKTNAQDSITVKMIDEVVVTAHKYPGKSAQTGKVLLVISREQLEKQGGRDLSQILAEQTGMYIGGANSNPGKDKSIYLRGGRIEHTLITIDGMPQYDPSGIGSNFDIRNMPIEMVERIEILKGSQSTLYGSDAIAGVINIITKRDARKKMELQGSASYGSNGTHRQHLAMGAKKTMMEWNVGFVRSGSKGIDETVRTDPNAKGERDGYSQQSIYGSISLKPGKEWRIHPFFRSSVLKGALDQGAYIDEWDFRYSQKINQWGLMVDGKIGKNSLSYRYNYSRSDRNYTDDSILTRNGFSNFSYGRYKASEHFTDIFTTIPLGNKAKWTTGSDLRYSNTDQFFSSVGPFGNYSSAYGKDSLVQRQWSGYTSLQWILPKGWNAEAGTRIISHSRFGTERIFNFNPSFLLRSRWKIYANISSGFRTPSLYQLLSEYGNPFLKPEHALSKEAGLQYYGPNDRLQGRITFFDRKVKDLVFFYFDPVTYKSQYINQDRQHDHGLEVEGKWVISKKVYLKGGYMFVDGRIFTIEGGKDTSYSGLLRRPKHSGNLSMDIQLSKKLNMTMLLQYFGERNDLYFDSNTYSTVETVLDAYVLWNAYVSYRLSRHVHIFTDLRNMTNSRYTEISGFSTLGFNGYFGIRLSL